MNWEFEADSWSAGVPHGIGEVVLRNLLGSLLTFTPES